MASTSAAHNKGPDADRWTHDLYEQQNSVDARLGSRSNIRPAAYASAPSSSGARPSSAAAPRRNDIQARLGPSRSGFGGSTSRLGANLAHAAASAAQSTRGALPSAGATNGGVKLVIENLHFDVTETDLKELFEPFNITSAHIHYDQTDRSLGRALLVFPTRTDADAARDKYNGMLLDEKAMTLRDVDMATDGPLLRLAAPRRAAAPSFDDRYRQGGGRWQHASQADRDQDRYRGGRRDDVPKGGAFDLRQELGFRTKDLRRDAAARSRSRSRSRSRDRAPRRRHSRSRSRDRRPGATIRDRPKFTFVADDADQGGKDRLSSPRADTAAKFTFVEPRRYTRRAGDDVEDGELDEGEVYVSAMRRRDARSPPPQLSSRGRQDRDRHDERRSARGERGGDRRGLGNRDLDAMEID